MSLKQRILDWFELHIVAHGDADLGRLDKLDGVGTANRFQLTYADYAFQNQPVVLDTHTNRVAPFIYGESAREYAQRLNEGTDTIDSKSWVNR